MTETQIDAFGLHLAARDDRHETAGAAIPRENTNPVRPAPGNVMAHHPAGH